MQIKRLFVAALVVAALAGSARAQSITVPAAVQIDAPGLVVIRATAIDADDVRWYSIGAGLQTFPEDVVPPKLGTYLGFTLQAGVYKIGVIPAKAIAGKAVIGQPTIITVTVGTPAPPVPPTPPTPPAPPSPVSTPAVLVVYDTTKETSMPAAQQKVLYDASVRSLLNAKLPLGPDGKTHEWRIWDASLDPTLDPSPALKALFGRPHSQLPWVVISNGKTLYEGPLPATVADMQTLLGKQLP